MTNGDKFHERLQVIASSAKYIPFRADAETASTLETLAERFGGNRSAAIRAAIRDAAVKQSSETSESQRV